MQREFIHLEIFDKRLKEEKISDDSLKKFQEYLALNPKSGVVITGANGLRKIRYGFDGKGKSGGLRIFYLDIETHSIIYLFTIISKSKEENLNKEQRNYLGNLVKELKNIYREQ